MSHIEWNKGPPPDSQRMESVVQAGDDFRNGFPYGFRSPATDRRHRVIPATLDAARG
jgi:hypothetical protein